MKVLLFIAFLGVSLFEESEGKLKEGECEVCISFLKKFEKTLEESDRKDQKVITEKLKKVCKKAKNKENKFCYYVGGTEDAATYRLNDIVKPLSYYKPVESICEALKKNDKEICLLRPEKEIDWKNVNLKKLKVKDLKKILNDWDETCSGCLEKSEFIKKIEKVKPKHIEL